MKNSKRLFIAINLPDEFRQELSSIESFFHHPAIRWIPAENLHVTLHFIGQTPLEDIPVIIQKISIVLTDTAAVSLTPEKIKVVRRKRIPVMIWAGFRESESFTQLAARLQNLLPGDRGKIPVPHVTLARIKNGRHLNIRHLPVLKPRDISVRHIELMESIPGNPTSVYKILETFELGGARSFTRFS